MHQGSTCIYGSGAKEGHTVPRREIGLKEHLEQGRIVHGTVRNVMSPRGVLRQYRALHDQC
jgi:hypothetical protein